MRAAYTPASLAERWDCSERSTRNMIANGILPSAAIRALKAKP